MKINLEINTDDPSTFGAAYKVLNLFKGADSGAAANPTPAASATTPVAPAAPAPAAPVAPMAVPATAPAPVAPTAPAAASPSSPAPVAPPPVTGGISAAQFSAQVQAFAKHYTPKACKARFVELATAFGQKWDKTTDIPAERYAEVMPWFAVQA